MRASTPGLLLTVGRRYEYCADRLNALPASRFEEVGDARALGELLEGLYDLLSEKEASDVAIAAKIKEVERLTGPRFGANNNALSSQKSMPTRNRERNVCRFICDGHQLFSP